MLLIKRASEVYLPNSVAQDTSILVDNGRIQEIGPDLKAPGAECIDAAEKTVLPGFVDSHTHVVFAGSREFELDMKLQGFSYKEIAAAGGGIGYTVKATRAASADQLMSQARPRLDRMLAHGTTTVEAKSGYGLDTKSELKLLRVIRDLAANHPMDVVPTFLGAHAVPSDMETNEYIDVVIDEMIPAVAEERLAVFCDVFCETGYFDVPSSRAILQAGSEHGMIPRLHADEFADSGAAHLAAELRAASADHLLMASDDGICAMAQAVVIAVLLPAVPFALMQERYADARHMINAGLTVALASDLNPNCWTENMQFVVQLACFKMGMTPREAIDAATINGAKALRLDHEVGSIEEGKKADLLVVDAPSHQHVPYHFGVNLVEKVIKNGVVV